MISVEQISPQLTWRVRHDVLHPDKLIGEMELDEDAGGMHFGAFMENKLVGVVSLFKHGNDFQLRKFAVLPEFQNKGAGRALLQRLLDEAKRDGAIRIWCNARTNAIPFYIKHGFEHTGRLFSKNGHSYEILEKSLSSL
jgi:GNAT superfamily N-acetyltransferase